VKLLSRISAAMTFAATGKLSASAFEGAMQNRRLIAWKATQENINTLLASGGDLLRARARQIVRSNPYASNAADSFVANAVGAGIAPSSLIADTVLKDEVQRVWLAWTDEADADNLTDFYGLQALAARAMFEAGECFVRFRPRRPEDGLTVPLQLQLLEAEHLPFEKCEISGNGNQIRCGIEFDKIGRRVAYHFYRKHPGDTTDQSSKGEIVRVSASEILHLYRPERPGQIRGVPWMAPALVKLYLLDQYDDAELDRKKVAALFAGFITKNAPEDTLLGEGAPDNVGGAVAGLSPGTMQVLTSWRGHQVFVACRRGWFLRNVSIPHVTRGRRGHWRIPYTNVTGDLKAANYSSIRAGTVEFRRRITISSSTQRSIFQLCRPVWKRWLETAALSGALTLPAFCKKHCEIRGGQMDHAEMGMGRSAQRSPSREDRAGMRLESAERHHRGRGLRRRRNLSPHRRRSAACGRAWHSTWKT
jgi:lambda family phage portal protein